MSKRVLLFLCCITAFAVFAIQWSLIVKLRGELRELRETKAPQLTDSPPVIASSRQDQDSDRIDRDNTELLQLRNEVHALRERIATLSQPTIKPEPSTANPPQPPSTAASVAQAAITGDFAAVDQLEALTKRAHTERGTNSTSETLTQVRMALQALGDAAIKGNADALQSLIIASRRPFLQGFAVQELGKVAGEGNEQALEPLLHPEKYFLTQSSVVTALKPAADKGNAQAIQALANVAAEEKSRALWYLAAQSLEGATQAGNPVAIDAMGLLVRSKNDAIRRKAYVALETASFHHPKAAETLRALSQ